MSRTAESSSLRVVKVVLAGLLTAIAIALHIVKIPFPMATFLKFDAVGIPLAVIALLDLGLAAPATLVTLFGVLAMGGDPVGASMKALAEFSTWLPLALVYRALRRKGRTTASILPTVSAVIGRVAVMALANYLITPWWLLAAKVASNYEAAVKMTINIIPAICVFNAIVALYVSAAAIPAYEAVRSVLKSVIESED